MVKKTLLALLTIGVAFGAFATGVQEGEAESQDPPVVRFFRPGIRDNWAEDPVILGINEALGIDLQIVTAGWGDFSQKRNLILATGEPMDILSLMGDRRWVDEGAILPLDDYIDPERHPWIDMVTQAEMFQPVVYVDGEIYHIPGVNAGSDYSMVVRKDWLDELGMDMPQSGEDFYNMLKAFDEMDDTGSTVPWAIEGGGGIRRGIYPILLSFGVPTSETAHKEDWVVNDNGELESILFMDETKAALRFMNRLYNEGLINSDFPSLDGYPPLVEKYMRTGLSAFHFGGNPMTELKYIRDVDPDAELEFVPPWSHDEEAGYEFVRGRGGINNCNHAIASASEDPTLALDVVEYLNSKEGRMLTVSGVEGVHWENLDEETGLYTRLPAYEEQWGQDSATGYHFYFGADSFKGYVPHWEYDSFEEAYANRVIVVPRERAGKMSVRTALEQASNWIAGPHQFKFARPAALHDESSEHYVSRGDMTSAIVEGWTRCIAGTEEEFDENWDAYIEGMMDVGWETWQEQWQKYYDENY